MNNIDKLPAAFHEPIVDGDFTLNLDSLEEAHYAQKVKYVHNDMELGLAYKLVAFHYNEDLGMHTSYYPMVTWVFAYDVERRDFYCPVDPLVESFINLNLPTFQERGDAVRVLKSLREVHRTYLMLTKDSRFSA